ncbi:MAG: hypothetical protein J7M25_00320 [Deltaproteobacteria bacterium]|nr:hypothetical protein [Deltaproteobacteria bacterium]
MQPIEIIDGIQTEKLDAILSELNSAQCKAVLKAGSLATKLPPGKVSQKARKKAWGQRIRDGLAHDNDALASELLYQWILHHRRDMLTKYLNSIGVENVRGETEESFTKTVPEPKLIEAALALCKDNDPVEVAMYVLYLDYHQDSHVFGSDDRILSLLSGNTSEPSVDQAD